MLELFGKNYYINVDEIIRKCRPEYIQKDVENDQDITTKNENGETVLELNVFKFEIYKACLERVLNEYEQVDEKLGAFGADESTSASFRIAFNTLIKYDILIENDNDE